MATIASTGRRLAPGRVFAARRAAAIACGVLMLSFARPGRARSEESFKPFRIKSLDGVQISLADVLGKATLVVFFFPTCPYCNAAFPAIQRFHDAYRSQGLSTVWINVVPEEERLIPDWRSRHGYTVPVLLGGRTVRYAYKVKLTPTHYLLDEKGNVISRREGYQPGDERQLEQEIRNALGRAP